MSWQRISAIVVKFWYATQRDMFRLFDIFFWPVLELFVWGIFSIFIASSAADGANLVTMLLGAVVMWSFFTRASKDISLAMIDEMWSRNFINIFSTPITMGEYIIGIVIVGFVKLLFSVVFMFSLAYLFYGFHVSALGFSIIPSAIGLTLFGWTLSIVVQSFFLRYGHTVEVFIWAVAALVQPFSCIFYPVSALPGWARPIAHMFPSMYIFENMRSVISGQGMDWMYVGISVGLTVFYLFLSIIFLFRSFAFAKQTGNLVKNY